MVCPHNSKRVKKQKVSPEAGFSIRLYPSILVENWVEEKRMADAKGAQ